MNWVDNENLPPQRVSKQTFRVLALEIIRSDEGLALKTSALELFAVASLRYQLSS